MAARHKVNGFFTAVILAVVSFLAIFFFFPDFSENYFGISMKSMTSQRGVDASGGSAGSASSSAGTETAPGGTPRADAASGGDSKFSMDDISSALHKVDDKIREKAEEAVSSIDVKKLLGD